MKLEKKYNIEIDKEVVSAAGRAKINVYLDDLGLPRLHGDLWSWGWIETRGAYHGKLPKRVAAYLKAIYALKLTPEQISEIGNIARDHVLPGSTYLFDFTDKFDWSSGGFGDCGSCFWGCRDVARGVMEKVGVIAIRFYDALGYSGIGRAWLYKLSDTQWILFNAYGGNTITYANIFAHFLRDVTDRQWEYDNVNLTVNGDAEGLIYINSRPQIIYVKDNMIADVDLCWPNYTYCKDCEYWFPVDDGCECCL
jgi:hypothetical protein